MKKKAIITAALVAVLAAAIAVPVVTAGGKPKPTFAVLKHARTSADKQLELTGQLAQLVKPGSIRYAGAVGASQAYVAQGPSGATCFLLDDSQGTTGSCIESDSLRDRANYVGSSGGSDTVDLLVPVPDAYSEADVSGKTIKAKNNVALTTVPKRNGKVKIKGNGGELETNLALAE